MRIRTGFVSNSSSTSFCIVGTKQRFHIHRLAEAEGFLFYGMAINPLQERKRGCEHPETSHKYCSECGSPTWETFTAEPVVDYLDYGYKEGKAVTFYGSDEPNYVGVDAKELLEAFTLPETRRYFHEHVKEKLGIDVPLESIDLYYGAAGNG